MHLAEYPINMENAQKYLKSGIGLQLKAYAEAYTKMESTAKEKQIYEAICRRDIFMCGIL